MSADDNGNTLLDVKQDLEELKKILLSSEEKNKETHHNKILLNVLKVNHSINNASSIEDLLDITLEGIAKTTQAIRGFVMLLNERSKLVLKAEYNINGHIITTDKFEEGRRLLNLALKQGEAVYSAQFNELTRKEKLGNKLCVPLKIKKKTLGVIYIDKNNGFFDREQLEAFEIISTHTASALENFALSEDINITSRKLKRKIWDLNSLFDMSRHLSSSLNSESILKNLLFTSMGIMGIETGVVMSIEDDKLVVEQSSGLDKDLVKSITFDIKGQWARTLLEGMPVLVRDLKDMKEFREEKRKLEQLECTLCLPMVKDNQLKGMFGLGKKALEKSYAADEIDILITLTNQAVVALDNAYLFEDLKEKRHQLKRQVDQLATLHKVGQTISSTLDLPQLLELIYEESGKIVNNDSFFIALYDSAKDEISFEIYVDEGIRYSRASRRKGKGLTSWVLENKKYLLIKDSEQKNDVFPVTPSLGGSERMSRSWLGVPLIASDNAIGVIAVQSYKPNEFTEEHLQVLSTLATQAAIAIENAQLYEQVAEKERIAQELKIARDIQMNLLPPEHPKLENFDIWSISYPAQQVGGDFFDYFTVSENVIGLCVGDVAGKGIPAALYMAVTSSILQAKAIGEISTKQVLFNTNHILCQKITKYKSVVVAYGVIDLSTHLLRISNCGLVSPIYFPANAPKTCKYLKVKGMPLGITRRAKYDELELNLYSGDVLVLTSDGIIEAQNKEGEMFGLKRMEQVIHKYRSSTSAKIIDQLLASVQIFVNDTPQYDDITVMVVKVL